MAKKELKEIKAGRPTIYGESLIKNALVYLELCDDEYETKYRPLIKDGIESGEEAYIVKRVKLPSIEGLAYFLGVHRDTLYEWEKEYPIFSDILNRLRSKQADELINKGLSGDYNPTIVKVLLTKHGYREGIDQTTNDKDLVPDKQSREKANEAIDVFFKLKDEDNKRLPTKYKKD